MDVKVIEPITHFIKEFYSPNDFDSWYKSHQEEMDKLTTHKLNKKYHINGYRVTRIKGVLSLKKAPKGTKPKEDDSETEQRFIAIENEISDMSDDIKNIKLGLQSIQDYFKQLIPEWRSRQHQWPEWRYMDGNQDSLSLTTWSAHIFRKSRRNRD